MKLTEDDLYRSSTQYRNWSFTRAQLADQRLRINLQATERVKANLARVRAQRAHDALDIDAAEVTCLTADEELKIVDEFSVRAIALGNHYSFPLNVVVCRRSHHAGPSC